MSLTRPIRSLLNWLTRAPQEVDRRLVNRAISDLNAGLSRSSRHDPKDCPWCEVGD